MCGYQANYSGCFFGLNPDRACTAKEGKRILTNNLTRTFNTQRDRGIGKWSNSSILIGDSQNDACRIDPITHQFKIIWLDEQLAIRSSAGHVLCNNQLASEVTFDLQITPWSIDTGADVYHKRRVRQV